MTEGSSLLLFMEHFMDPIKTLHCHRLCITYQSGRTMHVRSEECVIVVNSFFKNNIIIPDNEIGDMLEGRALLEDWNITPIRMVPGKWVGIPPLGDKPVIYGIDPHDLEFSCRGVTHYARLKDTNAELLKV